jgi:protein disulfide-isomerase A1
LIQFPNVKLATVDATVEQQLASSFGVKGYPTLKFFKNGVASDYTVRLYWYFLRYSQAQGGRNEAKIVSWIMKAINAPVQVLADADHVRDFQLNKAVSVIGFFPEGSADIAAFSKSFADEGEVMFGLVHEASTATGMHSL